jgi:ferric-dicitrate binding protein FerR (iron transport regulator)
MLDPDKLEQAWPADEPPAGFAERVVARAISERQRRRRRSLMAAGATLIVAAAAAVALLFARPVTIDLGTGERSADARMEVTLGARATAVLEPRAKISWQRSKVSQPEGDVFYRVEPGTPFRVETPAGDVSVTGTCFRVRVRPAATNEAGNMKRREALNLAGSAALGALAVVTVYEGRVKLSHANQEVELGAGEAGRLDGSGPRKLGDAAEIGAAEAALARRDRADYANANDELAKDVSELNRRLRGVEKQKGELEQQLLQARERLAMATDAAAPRTRNEFDLNQEDWAELAKEGTVKFRVPCLRTDGWKPGPETLDQLGLAPSDGPPLTEAYKKSNQRMWSTIRPLCIDAIGKSDVVDTLGPDTCMHVVVDIARKKDSEAASEAMRQVSEIRAGLRPSPAAGERMHPVLEIFLAATSEQGRFEGDLAESFGPEEAHRLAYAEGMCAGRSTFGGPGPRKP